MDDRIVMSVDVLNKIAAVLMSLPYSQVNGLIDEIQADIQQVAEEPEESGEE
jgi:hypothetical protein